MLKRITIASLVFLPFLSVSNATEYKANDLVLAQTTTSAQNKKSALAARKRFMTNYDAEEYIGGKYFIGNPYIYDGKTVAIVTQFETMLSANTGLFQVNDGLVIIEGIKARDFVNPTHLYMFSAKLHDFKVVDLPQRRSRKVLHATSVGYEVCSNINCWEYDY